ncbi:MAG: hypothetical protein EPO23_00345 [Xanthobacteraceae bacterium]|nr:MAG: hypothetical protein EPO23_00345 [Xanthobacteraceae bacterium]
MFFLLRMAFWIGLVLVLLPSDNTDTTPNADDKRPQVNAGDALSAASAAVSDMSQFCTRQPAACTVGGQAANVIGQRAQAGARKIYHIITDKKAPDSAAKKAPDHTGSIGPMDTDAPRSELPPDTLMPADLQIEWQGPTEPPTAPETTPAG